MISGLFMVCTLEKKYFSFVIYCWTGVLDSEENIFVFNSNNASVFDILGPKSLNLRNRNNYFTIYTLILNAFYPASTRLRERLSGKISLRYLKKRKKGLDQ